MLSQNGQFVLLITDGPKGPNVCMHCRRSRHNIALKVMPGIYQPATGDSLACVQALLPRPLYMEMGLNAVEVLSETTENATCRFTATVQRPISLDTQLPDNAPLEARLTKFAYGMQIHAVYNYRVSTDKEEIRYVGAGELATSLDKFYLPAPIEDLVRVYDCDGAGRYDLIINPPV